MTLNPEELALLQECISNPLRYEISDKEVQNLLVKLQELSTQESVEKPLSDVKNSRERLLLEANKVVNGQRDQDYGSPAVNFSRIASLWSIFLVRDISAQDVALMMILMKVARSMNTVTWDSAVDIAGYAACLGEFIENPTD